MKKVNFINKDNLKIARENVGMTTFFASRKITSSGNDLVLSWENGDSLPTWRQVDKLAKAYNIPSLTLFSEKLIKKNKIIPDYRVKKGIEDSDRVKKLVNFVIRRQEWLEQQLKEDGKKNAVQGSGKDLKTPKQLASFIKEKLVIDLDKIKEMSGVGARKKALKYLISKAEDKGIFVGKTISYHDIEVDEMRGLFISNDYCPFIVLNRRDTLSAQLFSIIHEFAHLFRKTEAISNSLEFRKIDNELDNEEVFCNKVAVEFFLPEEEILESYYNKEDIIKLSDTYKISTISIFYRLKSLGKIISTNADIIEKELKKESADYLKLLEEKKKRKKGGGSNVNNMKDSNGNLFNTVVAKYYYENKIGFTEASNLLKFSVENIW
jgi:Predicted Zn peptidase